VLEDIIFTVLKFWLKFLYAFMIHMVLYF